MVTHLPKCSFCGRVAMRFGTHNGIVACRSCATTIMPKILAEAAFQEVHYGGSSDPLSIVSGDLERFEREFYRGMTQHLCCLIRELEGQTGKAGGGS
jgi:hypothetical protein